MKTLFSPKFIETLRTMSKEQQKKILTSALLLESAELDYLTRVGAVKMLAIEQPGQFYSIRVDNKTRIIASYESTLDPPAIILIDIANLAT